jgi:hypothetical protein
MFSVKKLKKYNGGPMGPFLGVKIPKSRQNSYTQHGFFKSGQTILKTLRLTEGTI